MSPRFIRIALILSVILNLFILGGLAGAGLMWKRAADQQPLAGIGRPGRLRQAAQALTPYNRHALRQALRTTVQSLRPDIHKARDARIDVGELLVQPTLDPAALEQALGNARTADMTVRTAIEHQVVVFAGRLPLSERQALANGLRRAATHPVREQPARFTPDE